MNVQTGRALVAAFIALTAQAAAAQPTNSVAGGVRALEARVGALEALNETDIVGRWAVSGTTSCIQSSRGFDANLAPVVGGGIGTIVTQLTANSTGTRTFRGGGAGTSSGETQSVSYPAIVLGGPPPVFGGGASVAGISGEFIWSILPDGRLFIQDTNPIVQPFLAPPSRVGGNATILNLPPYVGHISKDRRTIVLAHPSMAVETSVSTTPTGPLSTDRICWRQRTLTRLPD
jgi:hypothetical protein